MARERFCKICRGWHDLDKPWPDNCLPERNWTRSDLASPMLIRDGMDPVQSQLDGKMYESKSALRQTYKQAGVVEVGNDSSVIDPKPYRKPRPRREDINASVSKALSQAGFGA